MFSNNKLLLSSFVRARKMMPNENESSLSEEALRSKTMRQAAIRSYLRHKDAVTEAKKSKLNGRESSETEGDCQCT